MRWLLCFRRRASHPASPGLGIELFRELGEIKKHFKSKSRITGSTWVVQKYIVRVNCQRRFSIVAAGRSRPPLRTACGDSPPPALHDSLQENPLLYDARKFDIRVWVCVVDDGRVWVHVRPYSRTSGYKFTLDGDEKFVHLTNYCQQIQSDAFEQHEEGNTLPWEAMREHLDSFPTVPAAQHKKATNSEHVVDQIHQLVLDSAHAAACQFTRPPWRSKQIQYELFGYDFMVDTNMQVSARCMFVL